jgi:hypothetical protein
MLYGLLTLIGGREPAEGHLAGCCVYISHQPENNRERAVNVYFRLKYADGKDSTHVMFYQKPMLPMVPSPGAHSHLAVHMGLSVYWIQYLTCVEHMCRTCCP